jgi:hypothetical protein
MRKYLLFTVILVTAPAFAQDPYATANCEQDISEYWLEVGNVNARIFNNAPIGWRPNANSSGYFVPPEETASPLFTSSFIAAGQINDELRVAGSSYGPYEMWPGPVPSGEAANWDCTPFNRFWMLDRQTDFQPSDAVPAPTQAILNWPVDLGAPFIDRNGVPGYQPEEGDYPVMFGDRQLWWIMNDRGNDHTRFNTDPLGIEVRASAFGFDAQNDLGNVTFYRYEVTNKGPEIIHDLTLGMYADLQIGFYNDDRAGTDTTLAMWYQFNSDNEDEGKMDGYGSSPPAAGFAVMDLRHSAGTLPSDFDLPPSHNLAATAFMGGGGAVGDPGNATQLYNVMTGRWKDGSIRREGGRWGHESFGGTGKPMPFFMPGDPLTGAFWSELNIDGNGTAMEPLWRTGIMATPTFDLGPDEWASVTFALVWARGSDHMDAVTQLRHVASGLHDTAHALLAPRELKPPLFQDGNPPENPNYPFWVDDPWPNPASDRLSLNASFHKSGPVTVRIVDGLGRIRIRKSLRIDQAGTQDLNLDISSLPSGSYMISVESWSRRTSHSFVVLR